MDSSTAQPIQAAAGVLTLAQWLVALGRPERRIVLVGGTGHLSLSAEEEALLARELPQRALQPLAAVPGAAEIIVATGVAPGADLLFAETAAAWFAGHGRPCTRVGLLPVPPEVLWDDWLMHAGAGGFARRAAMRARFDAALRACDTLVELWDAAAAPDWEQLEVRQHQYRRLGAVLAGHCDVLVAMLRPDRRLQPGGTAEVVAWREHRAAIPPELGVGPRAHRSGWPHGDRLVILNPAGLPAALQRARDALRDGNYLLSYDLAQAALKHEPASEEHEYVRLQALAGAGSTEAALRRFAELPASLRERDEDWLALAGRLHKDLGLRGGPGASGHFQRAAACYRTAFERTGGTFSAVNAATTALLGGDPDAARALARVVLERLPPADPGSERDRYFAGATEAEAALLLGDAARAHAALTRIDALLAGDINARSRTRRQLRRICQTLAIDARVLAPLRLPPVICLGPGAADALPAHAFVYAGVTEPRELAAAEQALAAGARLHAVLAAPRERMLAHWQWAFGPAATRRLGAFLDAGPETSVALGFLEAEDRWCEAYVGAMALGLSRLAARRLDCEWRPVGLDPSLGARTQDPPPAVVSSGHAFRRRFAAVIFADFAGFSRLPDRQLPVFWAQFMRSIAERLTPLGGEVLLKRTWGDALHFVCATARGAATAACTIQACLEELRPALPDALAVLELRLAAHYAPVFEGLDPIEAADTFFGTQLSFTARIEPVTPPGMIFVTEAFAAQLALETAEGFVLEYAGAMPLAKGYGESRLFSLRAALD